jgi:dTDP-glucose 4,6-dehydratase
VKVLVTGSAGFIGSHLCRHLQDEGCEVSGIDHSLSPAHELRLEHNVHAMMAWKPDLVIHLAAQVGRLFGEDDLMWTITDNAGITSLVARECGRRDIQLVYASTSEVYGDQGDALCYEDGPVAMPYNLYGLSKRHGEEVCKLYARDGLIIWRITMPYGPGLPPGRGRAAIVNMLWQADNDQPIPVHRGSERSWCWIGDTVRAMSMTLDFEGIFNVGREDAAVSMRRVAEIACDLTGASYDLIQEIDAPANQTVVKRLSTKKIRGIGWEPEVELEEGMRNTLEWLRSTSFDSEEAAVRS